MAKIDGNYMRIKIEGVVLSSTNDVDFTLTKDVQETTTQDSAGWKERHGTCGVREVTGSFKGMYDPSGTLAVDDITDMITNNEGLVTVDVGDTQTGGVYYSFEALMTQVGISGSNDKIPTFSGNFVSSGAVTSSIVGGTVPEITSASSVTVNEVILTWNVDMNNPASYSGDFTLKVNGSSVTIESVAYNTGNQDEYLITFAEDLTSSGDTLTLTIVTGNIESLLGVNYPGVTNTPVTNSAF